MILHRCKNCCWFDCVHHSLETKKISDRFGYCRKHHPIVFLMETNYYGAWPLVDREDFCGEFRSDSKE